MKELITFDAFEPGAMLGESVQTYDESMARGWQQIFGSTPLQGANGPAEAAGLVVVMMMRAYLNVVTPRPPGNVHARQRLTLNSAPRPGESVHNFVSCVSKEVKRERRYVDLGVHGVGEDGRPVYHATMSLIWAA